ncbi:hypothetical protein EOD08_06510 [Mesorhizobium sp. M6A.T.Ca.TU.002.02.2.1]|nr:hypothetical protein EOD08_06510 [Mesorhizobium sp. M6A.T.Ca.TU.002.02.2.1]
MYLMTNSSEKQPITIHIVYPLLRGNKRFKIERGRRWSVVEHLLLKAVCDSARTAQEVSELSKLPRRVVVEAFTRLMRATWVEIRPSGRGPLFLATDVGQRNALLDDLPMAIIPDTRWITYYIDDVTNCVFRWRDIINRSRKDLPQANSDQYVHLIGREGIVEDLSEIYRVVEGPDELIVGAFPNAAGLAPTYGLISVRNGLQEGMPKGASPAFVDMISKAYRDAASHVRKMGAVIPAAAVVGPAEMAPRSTAKDGLFESGDLIIDDRQHEEAFINTLRNALDRVIIHSTFITANIRKRLPALLQAASRGVRIDLFWGQNEETGKDNSSQSVIKAFREWTAESSHREFIKIHQYSTSSHAKFMISNDRRTGWTAILGSCNWLATDFDSFEVSVRLRDTAQVAELVNCLSMMSPGRKGIWNETAQELAALSRRIQASPKKSGRRVPMRLLYTGDHAKVPIEARDRCQTSAFVTSHRIGVAGKAVTLYPLISGAMEKGIEVSAYYGRTTGALSGIDAAEIAREYAVQGLSLRPVFRPRLHAKVLGWDSDCLAVSSFNWLSVDPSEHNRFREIGVFVESPRIAESFRNAFESAQWS